MLQQIYYTSNPQKCILQCQNAKYFFDFPEEDIFRNLWLYKLGLEQCDETSKVCNNHFSSCMLSPEDKYKLLELAVPDRNLPSTSLKKRAIYDKLIKKLSTTEKKAETKISTSSGNKPEPAKNLPAPVSNVSNTNHPIANFPSDTSNWLDDSSNLLMDYQLRIQGRHMCDVIELPEYIVVFTVLKPKEIKPPPRTDLLPSKSKQNLNPLLLSIPPTITVTQTDPKDKSTPKETINIDDNEEETENNCTTTQAQKEPEIDYVYYMTEESKPRREREVQVHIPNNTTETAIQCDVQLDNDMIQMSCISRLYCKEPELSDEQINKHECLVCGEILSSYAAQRRHAAEHEKTTLLCAHCGEVFSTQLKLKAHEKNIRSENELEIKKALRCPKLHCKKAFHSKKQLNNHIDQHIQKTEHKCKKCLRLYPSSLKLHVHQKSFKNCFKSRWPRTQGCNCRRK